MQKIRVVYQDEFLAVVDKPGGISVHPPEDPRYRTHHAKQLDVLRIAREQFGKYIYPVHRLDRATSGLLILSFGSKEAGLLQQQFKDATVRKSYVALVRGWTQDAEWIDSPLTSSLEGGPEQVARTYYETLYRFEIAVPTGKHSTSRFSLINAFPETGRLHQIRRHLRKVSHPLIGDTVHGDGKQNNVWRDLTSDRLLYLKAYHLKFSHPNTGKALAFHARWNRPWQKVFDLAGFCPYLQSD